MAAAPCRIDDGVTATHYNDRATATCYNYVAAASVNAITRMPVHICMRLQDKSDDDKQA